jgi:hypothetical protein
MRTRICLTGEGGDALFVGYIGPPFHLRDLALAWRWREWASEARAYLIGGRHSALQLCWISAGKHLELPGGSAPSWLTSSARSQFEAAQHADAARASNSRAHPAQAIHFSTIRDLACGMSSTPYPWDQRHPLFFRPLVEFMCRLPWPLKVRPTQTRVIQRRAMVGILPETIRQRPGKGRTESWLLKGFVKNWHLVEPLALAPNLAASDVLEAQAFRRACERLKHGVVDHMNTIWAALTIEMWFQLGGLEQIQQRRLEYQMMRREAKKSMPEAARILGSRGWPRSVGNQ